jgi:Big-like domain-containing protein
VTGSAPSGTVTFFDGGVQIAARVALNGNGVAALTTSGLTVGSHTITATYNGDGNNTPSTSAPLSQVVDKANTTTTLTSSLNPSTSGQLVQFTATVSGFNPGGTVTFMDGVNAIGAPVAMNGTTAVLTTSNLSPGSHQITAVYNGNGSNNGSTSNTLTQVVNTLTPAITVTAPNSAVTWVVGSSKTISWSHNLGTGESVNIHLSRDGGTTWESIAAGVVNNAATTGTYTWVVSGSATAQARIRVSWAANSSVNDLSDVNFTIATLFVTVTQPNTNVKWRVADTRALKFTHNLGVGRNVNIDVSRDNGVTWSPLTVFTTTAATSGSYSWLVSGPPANQARIRVTYTADPSVSDVSNVPFTILPRVTVTSPNSLVTWGAGSTRRINWTHNLGTIETVNLHFSADGGLTWNPLATGVPNGTATTGSWTGPMPAVATTQARIRVSQTSNPNEFDISDVNFTLASPAITVTRPNTNLSWPVGSTQSLTWSHNLGTLERVHIDLSRDGGATWEAVATNVLNSGNKNGTFNWIVTGPASNTARIRVTWAANVAVKDVSNTNFSIP